MRIVRAVNRSRDTVLAEQVAVADSFMSRGWGLLGHSHLECGQGMLITKTNCIHSMFMRFPFDALYIDKSGMACHLLTRFLPFRFGPLVWRADSVVELPAGTVDNTNTTLGDVIAFEPVLDHRAL